MSQQITLSSVLNDVGYAGTASESNLNIVIDMLSQKPTEHDIGKTLVMFSNTQTSLSPTSPVFPQTPPQLSWNIPLFIKTILTKYSKSNMVLEWPRLIKSSLDSKDFEIKQLQFIFNTYKLGNKAKWDHQNKKSQFLYSLLQNYSELIILNKTLVTKIFVNENTQQNSLTQSWQNNAFNSLDFFLQVLNFSQFDQDLKKLFDHFQINFPELICIGLSMLKTQTQYSQEIFQKLFITFITGHPNSNFVLQRVWMNSQPLLIESLIQIYKKDKSTLSRILDISQDLKALSKILDVKPYYFTIDLASLASRRDYLNLEKWLLDKTKEDGDNFIKVCLEFLYEKVMVDFGGAGGVGLSNDVVTIFIRILQNQSNYMSPENSAVLNEIITATSHSYQRNNPEEEAVPTPTTSTSAHPSFSPDVEEEATTYFFRIYKGEIRIPQMIELLLLYKSSQNRREQDLCNCIIQSLFDEYKFFPGYPEKHLLLTSLLFGSLIQHQICSGNALGNALRYILDACRQPPSSPLFSFGVQSLRQFQSRLLEWPQYCSLLLQIPHLESQCPDIVAFIKKHGGQQNITIDDQMKLPESRNSQQQYGLSVQENSNNTSNIMGLNDDDEDSEAYPAFSALKVDIIEHEENMFYPPAEAQQDKILFIINNISPTNVDQKITEMKDIFINEYSKWLSAYIVSKRVSIEPNFHLLYVQFLSGLSSPILDKLLLLETYSSIKVLLNSKKTVISSEERTLLKNLGMWLGILTVARNKPIKQKNLSFKDLLLEGYDNSRLIVVIPFVCKVLEQCMNSIVFKPPNPWLMATMKLLSELYHFADLKLNLKFEIEVLCKSAKLDVKDITPTNFLKSRPKHRQEESQLAKNFERLAIAPSTVSAPPSALSSTSTTFNTTQGGSSGEDVSIGYPNLVNFLTFNASLPIFQAQPSLKRIVHFAIDRAIREIINPVVERSVTIAGIATRELVVKDFALEPDENKMRKAAHLMVQSLSGSLASVTSREPLRMSMTQHLRTLFSQNGISEQAIPEQAIFILVADNLELACSVVEKSASEKAIAEIDEGLAHNFLNRRKHRERTGQPYYDFAIYSSSRYPSTLPESLRLKPNGLALQQLRVYEDFARLPRIVAQEQTFAEENVPLQTAQAVDKFTQFLIELEKVFPQMDIGSVTALPPQHDIHTILVHAPSIVNQSCNKDEVALILSQRVLNLLFKHESQLPLETYVLLLERVCETSKKVAKEVFQWLLFNDDDRKYNVATFVTILQARLLSVPELDMQLARLIDAGRMSVTEFAQKLARRCILEEPVLATQNDFFNCIDMFTKLVQRGKASDSVVEFMDALKKLNTFNPLKEYIGKDIDNPNLREQLIILFNDWVGLYHHPSSTEKVQVAHVNHLISQGILSSEDISSLFFRVCVEQSVEIYIKNKAAQGVPHVFAFQAVDAFARLIILLVKQFNDPHANGQNINLNISKINLATKILSIILLVLVHNHEQQRNNFNQRPLFRLFSTLLNDLHYFETSLQHIYFQILTAISNTFHTLQPSFLPGYTFSWLQLISHRHFLPKLLNAENQKGWAFYQRLMIDLFKYMAPFVKKKELSEPVRLLYRGTLRVLLILLHDFPEFLCCYHFSFMDVIPHQCVQLRNVILSAYPVLMNLPDPFSTNLSVTSLAPENHIAPQILSDYTSSLVTSNLKGELDIFLKNRAPMSFLTNLKNRLIMPHQDGSGGKYVVHLINSLVLYVGIHAINISQSKNTANSLSGFSPSAPNDIFQQLVNDLDSEGRYFVLSAIANQLRFPNSHTNFFCGLMLSIFADAKQEIIQEQVTRVLLERLIVNRPHPHGLLITFIELIRNPRFNFWEHTKFFRCAPEIEKLYTSVAKSIGLIISPQ
ncbi:hypothetical protein HK099_003913 [Clydaea vesicula]|uniref:General negative regulator of transcription subunit 1 n=1 Tax=Clydaea vesicula TaxID=447962 RepID=A0AAD5U2Z0_9FUNG|nr:hypothetical protein HK099_003913 [Clydaea vesicula]